MLNLARVALLKGDFTRARTQAEDGKRIFIHAVRGLRSIVHGFATLEAGGGFGMPLDRDESFLRLLRAYLAGLRTHEVAPSATS